jgi:hypothetical protein
MSHEARIIAAMAAAGWLACGGEEVRPAAAPMTAAEQSAAAANVLNQRPVVQRIRLEPDRPRPGERVAASVDASDPDGDPIQLSYQWRIGETPVDGGASSLHVGDADRGTRIEVVVIASDGTAESEAERAATVVGNLPPVLQDVILEPLGEVRDGHDVVASPRAIDPDDDPIEFEYAWRVNGESVGVGGPVLSADHFQRDDRIELTVVASDGEDESEPLRSDGISVVNSEPRVTSIPGTIDPDGVFRYPVAAEDPDGDRRFVYRLKQAPKGMTIDLADGRVEWVPDPEQEGTHPVLVEVDDRNGGIGVQRFHVEVGFEDVPETPAAPAP